ncbi:MerR family DNA-binding transcriptional regulator [Microbacterium lushaniae]|nr:MerR family DNA-binding transcriptional regulator [Microbacterium lushaniae]KAA9156596.1 MerR family DNA-binding transcriptional regulator [Microbacterium lushaniae]
MRIGELSRRTGIPTRMLRYYEEQGLLTSHRTANGYRAYAETAVVEAERVRGLISAGLTTRMTRLVLDIERWEDTPAPAECTRGLAEELAGELAAIEGRISCLTRSRDALTRYLRRTRHGDLVGHPASTGDAPAG